MHFLAGLTEYSSVWRPLVAVVEDAPLALCDMRSVHQRDLLAVDKVHTTHVNESYYVKYNSNQRWYYLPDQTPETPFIFITYDSQNEGTPSPSMPLRR